MSEDELLGPVYLAETASAEELFDQESLVEKIAALIGDMLDAALQGHVTPPPG